MFRWQSASTDHESTTHRICRCTAGHECKIGSLFFFIYIASFVAVVAVALRKRGLLFAWFKWDIAISIHLKFKMKETASESLR